MDSLALAVAVLHGFACVVLLAFAFVHRRTVDRQDTFAVALVWCAWFVAAVARDWIVAALPPPDDAPLHGLQNRVLLALDGALYVAWPLGIAAWVRWTFTRAHPWPIALAWIAAFGIPTAVYPAIRGATWFRFAGVVHVAALAIAAPTIVHWAKRREHPRPWHGAAIAAAWVSTLPALSFFSLPDVFESYANWVLRGLIGLHLWVLALLGGAKWKSS